MVQFKLRVFLDTNILVDVLCGPERSSYVYSTKIIKGAKDGLFEAFITTQSIIDAEFICTNSPGSNAAYFYESMLSMIKYLNIGSIDSMEIKDALLHPDKDFEDSAQFAHASSEGMDIIITSDRKFGNRKKDDGLVFMTPEQFVHRMENEYLSLRDIQQII